MGRVVIINNLAAFSLWHYLAVFNPPRGFLSYIQGKLVDFFLVMISSPKGWCPSPACPEAGMKTGLERGGGTIPAASINSYLLRRPMGVLLGEE